MKRVHKQPKKGKPVILRPLFPVSEECVARSVVFLFYLIYSCSCDHHNVRYLKYHEYYHHYHSQEYDLGHDFANYQGDEYDHNHHDDHRI